MCTVSELVHAWTLLCSPLSHCGGGKEIYTVDKRGQHQRKV
jgi:hypothetical protein